MLARLFSDRQTNVWMVLVAATVLTAVVGLEQHGGSSAVGLLLLAIAFIKIRLVALDFMEIRDAPLPLRILVEAYVGVTFLALVAILLFA